MFIVIRDFYDLQDHDRLYHKGEAYPGAGKTVSPERLAELAGAKNRLKTPLIQEVPEEVQPEPAKKKSTKKKK